jgi:hypothetical protein
MSCRCTATLDTDLMRSFRLTVPQMHAPNRVTSSDASHVQFPFLREGWLLLRHIARAGCLELLSLGTSHFVDHSGKNVTYRNHKVTPIRTKRLVTIIVSLVRDQARFGFRHGILTSHFRQWPRRSRVLAATRRELEPRSAWSPQRVGVPAELHGGLVRSRRGEKEQVPAWLSSRFLRTMLACLRSGQGQGDQRTTTYLNLILARTSMFCRCSRAMSWLLQNNVFSCGREDGLDWDDCYLPSQNLLKRRRG